MAVMGVGRWKAVFSENVTGAPRGLYLMNEEGQPGSRLQGKSSGAVTHTSLNPKETGFRGRLLEPSLSLGG